MSESEPSPRRTSRPENALAPTTPVLMWCEVCEKELWATPADAFTAGWDFAGPGGLYPAGIVSPRTCGGCPINRTVWWRLAMDKVAVADLTPRELAVLKRILSERPRPHPSDVSASDRTTSISPDSPMGGQC